MFLFVFRTAGAADVFILLQSRSNDSHILLVHEILVLVSELVVNFLASSPAKATDLEKSLEVFQRELVWEVSGFALERQHYLANSMLVGCDAEGDQVLRKVLKDDISSQRFVPDFENLLSNRRLVHTF